MESDDPVTEGTTEGTEAVVGGSQGDESNLASSDAAGETKQLPPDFLKQLESLDPSELPESVRIKLEKPLLANATRRNQETAEKERALAARENRMLEMMAQMVGQKTGQPPTPSQREILREKISSGELDAIPALVDHIIKETVEPQVNSVRLKGIFQDAQQQFPILNEPEVAQEVNQAFTQNPTLAAMSQVQGLEGTKFVLEGLAYRAMVPKLKAEVQQLKTEVKEAGEKAVAAYKAKVLGMSTSTAKAGSAPRGEPQTGDKTWRQAAEEAWAETFGG